MLLITPHWCLRWIIKPSDVSRLALTIKGRSYQCRLQLILPSPQRHLLLEADATYAIIGNNAVHEPRAPTLTGSFAKVVGTWTTNQQAHAKTPRVRPVNMSCRWGSKTAPCKHQKWTSPRQVLVCPASSHAQTCEKGYRTNSKTGHISKIV